MQRCQQGDLCDYRQLLQGAEDREERREWNRWEGEGKETAEGRSRKCEPVLPIHFIL